jgi:hypothetical protein
MLLQMAGPVGFFEARRQAIRHEMKAEVKKEFSSHQLSTVHVRKGNEAFLEWEDEGEFSFEGRMYDVVSSCHNADGTVTYNCLSDEDETELHTQLAKSVQRRMNENPSAANPVLGMLLTFIASPNVTVNFPGNVRHFSHAALALPCSPALRQVSPPPRRG